MQYWPRTNPQTQTQPWHRTPVDYAVIYIHQFLKSKPLVKRIEKAGGLNNRYNTETRFVVVNLAADHVMERTDYDKIIEINEILQPYAVTSPEESSYLQDYLSNAMRDAAIEGALQIYRDLPHCKKILLMPGNSENAQAAYHVLKHKNWWMTGVTFADSIATGHCGGFLANVKMLRMAADEGNNTIAFGINSPRHMSMLPFAKVVSGYGWYLNGITVPGLILRNQNQSIFGKIEPKTANQINFDAKNSVRVSLLKSYTHLFEAISKQKTFEMEVVKSENTLFQIPERAAVLE